MQVTVQVTEDVARALRGENGSSRDLAPLKSVLDVCGGQLKPLHEHTHDRELQTYYTMELPEDDRAKAIVDRLRATAGIEAAYVKPPDELP